MQTKPAIAPIPLLLASLFFCARPAPAQDSGVRGYWREPTGAVIHIESCGPDLCATLVFLSPSAPSRTDIHNPNRALQARPLCGLQIGRAFHLTSPTHAEGGTLYDPKSGNTYRGAMSSSGDRLNLRGYIGLPLFGRTETWTRTGPVETCAGSVASSARTPVAGPQS